MDNSSWSREIRLTVAILSFLLFLVLLYLALPLVEALAAAALIAYLLNPLVRLLMRRFHLKRSVSALLVYVILLLIVSALPALLGTVAFGLFQRCVYGIRILHIIETSYFYSHVSSELFGKKPLVS